ncbi:MAG TPA: MBL fold metallo-hydrolase [Deltaproteobacteria bacterium]|nr:MBL fold metallo-hydrolase [Deltaproteobacteria bacterium]OQC23382.1 MAG: ComEC family competence protein [Deltaproteobacteria bacterium ADurb.Bin072]HRW79975.1 MBL fold metallo-hydrolase [Desulfomonilia bacterium]HNQ84654.1 MBL fold metallo-hydrolase [Deltaproteobacteria bacterium]HNS88516.1 MBL fold metallo-hydrolase [Deltaproteobacteria bacterium]
MGDFRITVLVENTASKKGLLAEHGLSVWIESEHGRFLFDTGQGPALGVNADMLGIPLERSDAVMLSHGHYDHTGGLPNVLHLKEHLPVYTHPAALEPKYAMGPGTMSRDIGMPSRVKDLVEDRAELRWIQGPTEVSDGLLLTGPIPRRTGYEDTGGPFFADASCRTPDGMPDDQAAFLRTNRGVFVVLGCAHAGVINTLWYIRELTGNAPFCVVMGGMHLVAAGRQRMDRTVEALKELDIERIFPAHCTGPDAVARLRREFPDRCFPFSAGTVLDIEG